MRDYDDIKRLMRLCLLSAAIVLGLLAGGFVLGRCTNGGASGSDTVSVRVDSVRDTVYVEIRDTVPVVRNERVVEYIKVAASDLVSDVSDSTVNGQCSMANDSLAFPIVQREYSDDSTYTAYVSGLHYADWPKLDSIIVRRIEITDKVTETVTIRKKRTRWSVGVQAGYGYGFQYKGFEPYVGLGIGYALFPP